MMIPRVFKVTINGELITRVNKTKYLGILIHQNLKWGCHIISTVNITKYLIYAFIGRLSRMMTPANLRTIMYGLYVLLCSIATYAIIAYGIMPIKMQ